MYQALHIFKYLPTAINPLGTQYYCALFGYGLKGCGAHKRQLTCPKLHISLYSKMLSILLLIPSYVVEQNYYFGK